jgi:hypothetical protein
MLPYGGPACSVSSVAAVHANQRSAAIACLPGHESGIAKASISLPALTPSEPRL